MKDEYWSKIYSEFYEEMKKVFEADPAKMEMAKEIFEYKCKGMVNDKRTQESYGLSHFEYYVARHLFSEEILIGAHEWMVKEKQRDKRYSAIVKKHYDVLLQLGFNKEKLEQIEEYSHNMDDKLVETVFILETCDAFGIPEKEKIVRDRRIGGGFYSDGDIYGYDITLNDKKYRIVLDDEHQSQDRENLEFGKSDDMELLGKQKEILEVFRLFSNAQTLGWRLKAVNEQIQRISQKEVLENCKQQKGQELAETRQLKTQAEQAETLDTQIQAALDKAIDEQSQKPKGPGE